MGPGSKLNRSEGTGFKVMLAMADCLREEPRHVLGNEALFLRPSTALDQHLDVQILRGQAPPARFGKSLGTVLGRWFEHALFHVGSSPSLPA